MAGSTRTTRTNYTEEDKQSLLRYLRENPRVSYRTVAGSDLSGVLYHFYGSRGNQLSCAKRDAGLPEEQIRRSPHSKKTAPLSYEEWHSRLEELSDYVSQNPSAHRGDLSRVQYSTLFKFFGSSINRLKEWLGIDKEYMAISVSERKGLSEEEWSLRLNELHQFLRDNLSATSKQVKSSPHKRTLDYFYSNCIREARKDAEVPEELICVHRRGAHLRISEEEWRARRESLHEYLRNAPNATHKEVNKSGHRSALGHFYNDNVNKAKMEVGIPVKHFNLKGRRGISYDEFMGLFNSINEFLLENPRASRRDVENNGLRSALGWVYKGNINRAKESLGLSYGINKKGFKKGMKCLPAEVWEGRRQKLLEFLRSNPHATRKEMLSREDSKSAISRFYKGHIVPALKDAGFSEEGIKSFIETYHLDAAETSTKDFIEYRERLGLPSPPLEDLVQEASIGIILAARARPRMSRKLATRGAKFRMMNAIYGHYPNSVAHIPQDISLRVDKMLKGENIDDVLQEEEIRREEKHAEEHAESIKRRVRSCTKENIEAALRALSPIPLEYHMLLDDFDEDDDITLSLNNIGVQQDLEPMENRAFGDSEESRGAAEEVGSSKQYQYRTEDLEDDLSNISPKDIASALGKTNLTFREKEILKLRFGIVDGWEYNLDELGRIFHVSRERVRQIEARALEKLQIPINRAKFARDLEMELSEEDEAILSAGKYAHLRKEQEEEIVKRMIRRRELQEATKRLIPGKEMAGGEIIYEADKRDEHELLVRSGFE